MTWIAVSLVWLSVQVTIVLAVVAGLYAVLGRSSPRTRSAVLATGLGVTFGLTLLAFAPWPNWWPRPTSELERAKTMVAIEEVDAGDVSAADDDVVEAVVAPDQPDVELESTWAAFATGFVDSLRNPPAIELPEERTPWWPTVVVTLFSVAAGIGVLRLLAGWWALARLRSTGRLLDDPALAELVDLLRAEAGCTRPIVVRENGVVSPAATFGWRRPVVLLAADWRTWTPDELRAVLAHEIAHIRRGDFLSTLWTELGILLHFYHPLMHWLANRQRLEHELAADAAAAEVSGGPRSYLRILAEMVLRQPSQRTSWSVATFLPTRRTFTRRIEVLRESRERGNRTGRISPATLAVAVSLLLGTGIVVAGLRNPGALGTTSSAETTGDDTAGGGTEVGEASTELDLSYIPRDAPFLFQANVAAIRNLPGMEQVKQAIATAEAEGMSYFGVPFAEMERVSFTIVPEEGARGFSQSEPVFVVRSTKDVTAESLKSGKYEPDGEWEGTALLKRGERNHIALAGPRTVLYSNDEENLGYVIPERNWANRAVWAADVRRVKDADIVFFGNVLALRREIGDELPKNQPANSGLGVIMPLYNHVDTAAAGVTIEDGLQLEAYLACSSEDGAKEVTETTRALLTLGRNWLKQARLVDLRTVPREHRALVDDSLQLADELLGSMTVEQQGKIVELRGRSERAEAAISPLVVALLPAVQQAREAARRTQSTNNMKQIGIAMHNYHATYGHFPPAVLTGPDGKTKYSWRVALLPFLDQQALYEQYDRNQPWDSEQNKKILETIVQVYREPNDAETSTNSGYFVLVGKGTAFDPDVNGGKGVPIRNITDGTSNSIMVVEAKRDIPWTKPEDIPIDLTKKELPEFGGRHPNVFLATLCDGAVRAVSQEIDKELLRILIGINDGKVIPSF